MHHIKSSPSEAAVVMLIRTVNNCRYFPDITLTEDLVVYHLLSRIVTKCVLSKQNQSLDVDILFLNPQLFMYEY